MAPISSPDKIYEPVADFYAGKSVFITGGTGFLGKVFIEKLLYSCPEIEKIYMLIRDKKGVSSELRRKDFINNSIFTKLKTVRPKDLDKIICISGDIEAPNLGLCPEDEQILIEKVSVIIHAAANIKFNVPLNVAWNVNVKGTITLIDLIKRIKNIKVYIHISTAFSQPSQDVLEEILYPAPCDIDEMHLKMEEEISAVETNEILNGYTDTYTFTKAVAEHVVAKNCGAVTTIIIRPSVVAAVKEHPMKGWVDNWYGLTGLTTVTAKNQNKILLGDENNVMDLIPVDYVANCVIVAGARSRSTNEVVVFNCCSSACNPITMKKMIGNFAQNMRKNDTRHIYIPTVYTKYKWLVSIVTFLFQIIPAYIGDLWLQLMSQRPRYMKLQSIIIKSRDAIEYVTNKSWKMKASGIGRLYKSLNASDQRTFPCDPSDIEWDEYMTDYYYGVRRFLEHKI